MSFKDLLKSAGLVEEVAENKSVASAPVSNTQPVKGTFTPNPVASASYPTPSSPVSATLTANVGVVDNKYIDHFVQVLDGIKAKTPDTDYYTFKKSFEATSNLSASLMENVRYQMVFGTLSVNGLTKDKLLASANVYLDGLNNDKSEYLKNSEGKKATAINTRQQTIDSLNQDITDSNAKIQELLKKISDDSAQVASLQNEIVDTQNEIDQKQKNFNTTFDTMYTQIQNDVNKITQFIQ